MSNLSQTSVPVWVITILMTVILALFGYLYAASQQRVSRIEDNQVRYWERIDDRVTNNEESVSSNAQRLSRLETAIPAVDMRLQRIENKLDALLSKP